MRAFKIALLFATLAIGFTIQAGAGLYDITFNDGNGNAGSGQVDVECANNNFYACSGYLNITSGGATGDWTLYAAGEPRPTQVIYFHQQVHTTIITPCIPLGIILSILILNVSLIYMVCCSHKAMATNSIFGATPMAAILWAAMLAAGKISILT